MAVNNKGQESGFRFYLIDQQGLFWKWEAVYQGKKQKGVES